MQALYVNLIHLSHLRIFELNRVRLRHKAEGSF